MNLTRRDTLAMAAAATVASFAGLSPAFAKEGDMIDLVRLMAPMALPDKVLGNADAKVTLIEYASPTCPHCALFSNVTLPLVVEQYVTTGKIKLILRPFIRNALDAAIFMLAEAAATASVPEAPADGAAAEAVPAGGFSQSQIEVYHNVVSTYFKTQTEWGTSATPKDAILAIAKQLGFTEDSFNAALTNQALFTAMETMREQALKDFGLEGTPTFYINGKLLSGEKTIEQMAAEIDPLLA